MRLFDPSLNEGGEFIGQCCYLASSDVTGVLERNEELRGWKGSFIYLKAEQASASDAWLCRLTFSYSRHLKYGD